VADDVVAVILNWNCADDTIRCLRAVAAGLRRPDIIVVDNGSQDDSVERLKRLPDSFSLVTLDRNLGFAGGMNAGIREAEARGAEWVWLLNADAVPRPDALSALLTYTDRFVVATSLQVTSERPDTPAAEPYVVAAMVTNDKVRPVRCTGCTAGAHEVDVVTGAALFLSVAWVIRVGLFDERFFHYKEEFDLVRRIGTAGGRIGLVCASSVWHKRGGSLAGASPRGRYYHHRNEVLYLRKHHAHPLRRMLGQPIHYRNLAEALLGMASGRHGRRASLAVLVGYWDGIRGVHGPTERF